MVIVPFSGSASAMVSGTLSPVWFTLSIINWPAFLFLAMRGASISIFLIFSAKNVAETILCICFLISYDNGDFLAFRISAKVIMISIID